jgi:Fe-S-cluster containining protein
MRSSGAGSSPTISWSANSAPPRKKFTPPSIAAHAPKAEIYEKDILSLSKNLGISRQKFLEQYTQTGTDGELILKRTEEAGCVFLDGNDCTIYEFRPKTCEGFPHLLKGMGSIQHKMWAYVDRATYCPIVYNWMEQVKDLTNFKK